MEHLVQYRIEAIDKITGVYRSLIGLQKKAAGNANATNSATAKANKAMNQMAKTSAAAGEKISNSMKYAVLRFQRTKKTIDDTEKSIKKTGSSLDWLKGKVAGVERRAAMMGNKFSNGLKAITSRLGGLGTAMAGVFTLDLIKTTFDTLTTRASDLNESANKAKVVFGSAYSQIEALANKSADAMGMSKQATLAATSQYAGLFKNIGFGENKTAKFSEASVRLAADLASFNNMPMNEALEALLATLKGESEPAMRFGVLIDEASLKQKAFDMGLIKSTKETLPKAIKTQAIFAQVLAQTKDAQGDFTRTKNDDANATRRLAAAQEDLQAKLGQKLLPLKLKLTNALIKIVGWVDRNSDMLIKWGETALKVGGFLLGLYTAAKTILLVSSFYTTVSSAILILRNSTILAKVATMAFNVVARLSPFGWIAAVITGIILLVKHWDTVKVYLSKFAKWAWDNHPFKWMIDLVDRIFPGFKSSLSNMFESIKSVFLKVVDWVYDNVLKPLFGWLGDLIDGFSFTSKPTANLTMGGGEDRKNLYASDRGGFDYNGVAGLGSSGDGKVKDLGVKSANQSLVSGGGKEMKNINIRIDKLIESFNISTETFGASKAQIKAEVQKILLSAVNEVNYQ